MTESSFPSTYEWATDQTAKLRSYEPISETVEGRVIKEAHLLASGFADRVALLLLTADREGLLGIYEATMGMVASEIRHPNSGSPASRAVHVEAMPIIAGFLDSLILKLGMESRDD